ncbi:hypothetical protein FA95DRAFT_1679311 [Auriscalpium vulgare]|uniref:Uncharacterized protein n=1 Tax=Auriscalpium vulgare TaxID=40419 RepID=A0ACB8RU26_9AGAM|nr:hypothetical protein FA95DRAFT_1679311 [Auriscalpium vulgare]
MALMCSDGERVQYLAARIRAAVLHLRSLTQDGVRATYYPYLAAEFSRALKVCSELASAIQIPIVIYSAKAALLRAANGFQQYGWTFDVFGFDIGSSEDIAYSGSLEPEIWWTSDTHTALPFQTREVKLEELDHPLPPLLPSAASVDASTSPADSLSSPPTPPPLEVNRAQVISFPPPETTNPDLKRKRHRPRKDPVVPSATDNPLPKKKGRPRMYPKLPAIDDPAYPRLLRAAAPHAPEFIPSNALIVKIGAAIEKDGKVEEEIQRYLIGTSSSPKSAVPCVRCCSIEGAVCLAARRDSCMLCVLRDEICVQNLGAISNKGIPRPTKKGRNPGKYPQLPAPEDAAYPRLLRPVASDAPKRIPSNALVVNVPTATDNDGKVDDVIQRYLIGTSSSPESEIPCVGCCGIDGAVCLAARPDSCMLCLLRGEVCVPICRDASENSTVTVPECAPAAEIAPSITDTDTVEAPNVDAQPDDPLAHTRRNEVPCVACREEDAICCVGTASHCLSCFLRRRTCTPYVVNNGEPSTHADVDMEAPEEPASTRQENNPHTVPTPATQQEDEATTALSSATPEASSETSNHASSCEAPVEVTLEEIMASANFAAADTTQPASPRTSPQANEIRSAPSPVESELTPFETTPPPELLLFKETTPPAALDAIGTPGGVKRTPPKLTRSKTFGMYGPVSRATRRAHNTKISPRRLENASAACALPPDAVVVTVPGEASYVIGKVHYKRNTHACGGCDALSVPCILIAGLHKPCALCSVRHVPCSIAEASGRHPLTTSPAVSGLESSGASVESVDPSLLPGPGADGLAEGNAEHALLADLPPDTRVWMHEHIAARVEEALKQKMDAMEAALLARVRERMAASLASLA